MKLHHGRSLVVGGVLGAAAGVVMAVVIMPEFDTGLLAAILAVLHWPATVLNYAWHLMADTSSGEAGWGLYPLFVIIQWAAVGLLCTWWLRRRRRSTNA